MEYKTKNLLDLDLALVCELCGSLVIDTAAHDLWHDILNGIAQKANRGESAWHFNQPLGGGILGKNGTYQ